MKKTAIAVIALLTLAGCSERPAVVGCQKPHQSALPNWQTVRIVGSTKGVTTAVGNRGRVVRLEGNGWGAIGDTMQINMKAEYVLY
jgi:hypothetical protein